MNYILAQLADLSDRQVGVRQAGSAKWVLTATGDTCLERGQTCWAGVGIFSTIAGLVTVDFNIETADLDTLILKTPDFMSSRKLEDFISENRLLEETAWQTANRLNQEGMLSKEYWVYNFSVQNDTSVSAPDTRVFIKAYSDRKLVYSGSTSGEFNIAPHSSDQMNWSIPVSDIGDDIDFFEVFMLYNGRYLINKTEKKTKYMKADLPTSSFGAISDFTGLNAWIEERDRSIRRFVFWNGCDEHRRDTNAFE